jgi:1-aminocyclopropane-1-carboxylate deaminase/D-cysteine desulfhydrase-like pyridoxal-dependent ACC family enzyme
MEDLSVFNSRQSPLQKLNIPLFKDLGIDLFVKRDDLLHPEISGNKWRKLKYNLFELEKSDKSGFITFGGAYSNHLHAVAAAGKEFDFATVGIVRGEKPAVLSPTLQNCLELGMNLVFVSRVEYRLKEKSNLIAEIIRSHSDLILLPEGGANQFALKGCAEIIDEIAVPFDYLCLACGTGATMAGILLSNKNDFQTIGFPVLKGGDFIVDEIRELLSTTNHKPSNFELKTDYHFGGYAKHTNELLEFIREFEVQTAVEIEQVYTGKMLFGVFDLAQNGYFKSGDQIIALHTGGLQGKTTLI